MTSGDQKIQSSENEVLSGQVHQIFNCNSSDQHDVESSLGQDMVIFNRTVATGGHSESIDSRPLLNYMEP